VISDVIIFADDLSGAAETAAAFLGRAPGPVLELDATQPVPQGVAVVDLDTRTMPAAEADRVLRTALAAAAPQRMVMHKIDSLLRGHVGAAIETLAARGPVIVAAGLPALGRKVRGGVLFVGDVPLHHTDLWHLESGAPPGTLADLISHPAAVCAAPADISAALAACAVAICDIADDTDLDAVVDVAQQIPGAQLVGTSALAAAIARTQPPVPPPSTVAGPAAVLTVVGTGAPNAAAQVAVLVDCGAAPVALDAERLLAGTADLGAVPAHRNVVITVSGSVPVAQQRALSTALGRFVAALDRRSPDKPDLVLTGGETARAVIDALGVSALRPIGTVHHGAVISTAPDGRRIVTRPGTFGDNASLADITAHLASTPEPVTSSQENLTMTSHSGPEARPVVAITMGDGAGIGPEVIVPALLDDATVNRCVPVVIGDAKRLAEAAGILGIDCDIVTVKSVADAETVPGRINVIDLDLLPADLPWGQLSAVAGHAAYEYIRVAAELAVRGEVQAICTAPLNKEALHAAGHIYPGHTELLAHLTGTEEVSMMLSTPKLKVIHVTTHIGLIDAVAKIEPGLVERTVRRGHEALVRSGNPHPKIGLCGINPHAGEGGLFGYGEEDAKIVPAVQALVAAGIDAHGPLPADTAFFLAGRGDYDLIVAMYHDQGHGPVKVLGIEAGVNITVGLPVIRTSVDHGTAFDIAGKGIAEAGSMIEALRQATELATSTTVLK
jgi:4-hydroxythreonine-4-phosphate dehydrogenase